MIKSLKLKPIALFVSIPLLCGTAFANERSTQLSGLSDISAFSIDDNGKEFTRVDDIPTPSNASASGGNVSGGDLNVDEEIVSKLLLENSVQSNAKALNIENTSNGGVASGTNIWAAKLPDDGSISTGLGSVTPLTFQDQRSVEQQNMLSQNKAKTGVVGGFLDYTSANNTTTTKEANSSAEGSVTANANTVDNKGIFGNTEKTTTYTGRGLSGGGDGTLTVDAGEINVTSTIEVEADALFGLVGGSTSIDNSFTTELPEMELTVDGGACVADQGANCSYKQATSSKDNSTSTLAAVVDKGAIAVQAENFSMEDMDIKKAVESDITLYDDVQKNAVGLNIVNNANGLVSNAINVGVGNDPAISISSLGQSVQRNVVIQRF